MIDDAMEVGVGDLASGAAAAFSYDVSKGVKASAARAGKGERGVLTSACRCQQGLGVRLVCDAGGGQRGACGSGHAAAAAARAAISSHAHAAPPPPRPQAWGRAAPPT